MRRALIVSALLSTLAAHPSLGQAPSSADSAAVMRGLISFFLVSPLPGAGNSLFGPVVIDAHRDRWNTFAAQAFLELASDSLVPKNDSIAYYSLHFSVQSVKVTGDTAVVDAVHSYCFLDSSHRGMNMWAHPITYRLIRSRDGWKGERQGLTMYLDGVCSPYAPKGPR